MSMFDPGCLLASCGDYVQVLRDKGVLAAAAQRAAERMATTPILIFDLVVITAAVAGYLFLRKSVSKLWLRALVTATGVFLFELFTSPMWKNEHLGAWAYVYCDVSWILTLGWTTIIVGTMACVDRWLPRSSAPQRFILCLGLFLALVIPAEMIVVGLGIRSYSPEVLASVSGVSIAGVPVEVLYYVPVFTSLVMAFSRYWNLVIDDALLVPVVKRKWLRAILIAFIGVFLFELMVEPIVQNRNFPGWSYLYRDISLIYSGIRVLLIGVSAVLIDRWMLGMSIPLRFGAALMCISALALPIEAWFINGGYRLYGASATTNYSGFLVPIAGIPVEIAFAIPCYLSLIVAFIRYWEIVFDNGL
jgi:hypothetical protein